MRTKEVADSVGVNTQTLRYYERRGLLPEPPRSPGGYRDYPGSVVPVLRFVKQAQRLGFTLTDVEELLQLAEGGPDSCSTARALAAGHVRDLDRRIADLQRMRDALTDLPAVARRTVTTLEEAEATGMRGSPTLLVDGVDPFAPAGAAPSLSCRLYRDDTGATTSAPTVTQLRTALSGAM